MKTVRFSSNSDKKFNLLIQIAEELGINIQKQDELSDAEMALPWLKVSKEQLEEWLSKEVGDGGYSSAEMKSPVQRNIRRKKPVRNGHRL